jgi:hypothetical protein
MLAAFGVAAFLVAWVANALVGLLSGERPRDTASLWFDIFFRFFVILELGWIGRVLSYMGITGWPRKAILFIGLICVLLFLAGECHRRPDPYTHTYPVQQLKSDPE